MIVPCQSDGEMLEAFAASAQLREHDIDALLVDGAKAGVRQAQRHPAVLAFDPEPALLQVRQETSARLVVRVGDVVPRHGGLSGDLADSSHRSLLVALIGRCCRDPCGCGKAQHYTVNPAPDSRG